MAFAFRPGAGPEALREVAKGTAGGKRINESTNMSTRPVILTAFSNVQNDPLPRLVEEMNEVANILRRADRDELIQHVALSVPDGRNLLDTIRDYREKIEIFHYGGHARDQILVLNDGQSIVEGIAGMFENLKLVRSPLKLVFLNGCATRKQVQVFFNAGVEAVIATKADVNDNLAKIFAVSFYTSLFKNGADLEQAFHDAVKAVKAVHAAPFIEEIPYRGIKSLKLKAQMEGNAELPWLLFVRKAETLKWRPTIKPASAIALADAFLQGKREERLELKRAERKDLEAQKEKAERSLASVRRSVERLMADLQASPGDPELTEDLSNLREDLDAREQSLHELRDRIQMLSLEIDDEEEGYLSRKALEKLQEALDQINYRDQLRYFRRNVDLDRLAFGAFILEGNKDCANDLLVRLLLMEINVDDTIGINKLEIDFSVKGNDAPDESNIWRKVKEHFSLDTGLGEGEATELILDHLETEHVVFHFKRLYDTDTAYNVGIIRKFWFSFCAHAGSVETAAPYKKKCFLFVTDLNCPVEKPQGRILPRGYETSLSENDRKKHYLEILPVIQPLSLEDLEDWVFDAVPRDFRIDRTDALKEVLGGDYGFVLPTIRSYCEKTHTDSIYESYYAQYEFNSDS